MIQVGGSNHYAILKEKLSYRRGTLYIYMEWHTHVKTHKWWQTNLVTYVGDECSDINKAKHTHTTTLKAYSQSEIVTWQGNVRECMANSNIRRRKSLLYNNVLKIQYQFTFEQKILRLEFLDLKMLCTVCTVPSTWRLPCISTKTFSTVVTFIAFTPGRKNPGHCN
jgi:hypothetical protein